MQKILGASTRGYLGLLDEILRNAARRSLELGRSQIDLNVLSSSRRRVSLMQSGSWIFRVEPHPDESFGHFIGRFRRANELSHRAIAEHLGIRVEWMQSWDSPSRRRNPTPLQLMALSKLVEVELNNSKRCYRQIPCIFKRDCVRLVMRQCPYID